ncbi:MAG TPA: glycosyltransferase family 4 protein, partial [Mucilaginibacter sp.]|nr:glycosyltransferase family 4 protein [Mucilaginibacter sp.]
KNIIQLFGQSIYHLIIKRVIFISSTVLPQKDAGGGSVVIYRHLERLVDEGKEVIIIYLGNGNSYKDKIQYIFIPKKPWYPFLRKQTPQISFVTMWLYYKLIKKRLNPDFKHDIIIGILGEVNNLILLQLYNEDHIPFFLFYHDDIIFNRYRLLALLSKQQINDILTKASFIFSVSQYMVDRLKAINIHRTKILYPIPQGYNGVQKPQHPGSALNFGYAGMTSHIHFDILNQITIGLNKIGHKLYCITGPLDGFSPSKPETIIIRPRFNSLNELFNYMLDSVNVNIVFYSFCLQHEPRLESSFPSKFVEFAQLGIPVAIIAPEYSSLGQWALKRGWLSYINSDDPDIIAEGLKRFEDIIYWQKCREQILNTIAGEFNSALIHQSFIDAIDQRAAAI